MLRSAKLGSSLAFLLVIAIPCVHSQYAPLEEEAPEALLDTELGSVDVELLIDGSWESELLGSIGYAFPSGGTPYATTYPGMSSGYVFSQRPDLLLSLWIQQQFFFEASILADYEINSLQMGYQNSSDGFLRQIILGTPGPFITSHGDVVLPESTKG